VLMCVTRTAAAKELGAAKQERRRNSHNCIREHAVATSAVLQRCTLLAVNPAQLPGMLVADQHAGPMELGLVCICVTVSMLPAGT